MDEGGRWRLAFFVAFAVFVFIFIILGIVATAGRLVHL
jgi:hypothetical protein